MRLNYLVLIFIMGLYSSQLCKGSDHLQTETWGRPPWQAIGKYTHPPIKESSGFVASRRFPEVYWTLNDSGNPAVLYATKLNGELIREFPVQGATNSDWEALEIDDRGRFWVGEIGNNSRMRDDLTIYVVPEPDPFKDSEVKAVAQYPYRYPDENVDAEGMFVADGFPYIVSKERARAILYRFTALEPGKVHVLKRVGQAEGARLVSGADLSADGKRLSVCTYGAVWVYHGEANNIVALINRQPWTLAHDFGGEAVGFDGYDLVFTTERRNIYRLPQWWYEAELPTPPREIASAINLLPTTQTQDGEFRTESYREAGIDIGGGHLVLEAAKSGASISQVIEVPLADRYEFGAVLTRGPEYGQIILLIGDKPIGEPYDCYAAGTIAGSLITFGTTPLKAGGNRITLQAAGKFPDAQGYRVGIDSYLVRPNSAFVQRYLVLGPFPKAEPMNIDVPLPPEVHLDLEGTFQGVSNRPIRWKEAETGADGRLNLRASIGEAEAKEVVAYAFTYVYSRTDRDATLLVGSNDQIAIWINGKEVHRHNITRWGAPDEDTASCQLQAGWNTVLCKIGQNTGGWALHLRVTDPDGSLKYALQRPSE